MSDRNDAPVDYEVVFPDTPHEPGETTAADAEAIGAPCSADEVMDTIDPHGVVRAKRGVDFAALRAAAEAATSPLIKRVHLEMALDDFHALANPSAVLAILDERDALVERCERAEEQVKRQEEDKQHLQTQLRDAIAARDRAIRALRRMVDGAYENTTHSILTEWQCRYCVRRHRDLSLIGHRSGCPVPDAEAVLREAEGAD